MENNDIKSQFNAGIAQAQEIRKLQNILNMTRLDPLAFNSFAEFPFKANYEITLQILTSLFQEVKPMCSPGEMEKIEATKKAVEMFLQKHPPIKANNKGEMMTNRANMQMVVKVLEGYETLVRSALGKHELNSPTRADASRAVVSN